MYDSDGFASRFRPINYPMGAVRRSYDKSTTRGQRTTADGGNRMLTMLVYLLLRRTFRSPTDPFCIEIPYCLSAEIFLLHAGPFCIGI